MPMRRDIAQEKLVRAFQEYGTCWNGDVRDQDYCLWKDGDVERMLKHGEYFGYCDYTDSQVEVASSIIASAAQESGNRGDIFDFADPYFDGDRASCDLSVAMLEIIHGVS